MKLLSLLIAVMLIAFIFVACDGDKKEESATRENTSVENDKKEITKLIEDFESALQDGDREEAEDLVGEDSAALDETYFAVLDDDEINLVSSMLENIKIDIEEIEINDDVATEKVVLYLPDGEDIDESDKKIKFEKFYDEWFISDLI